MRIRLAGTTLVLAAALTVSGTSFARKPAKPVEAPAARKPTLAVLISIDGLSWERLTYYRPWYTGGLKRLLDEGRSYSHAYYGHISSETGPGHASLGTGAPPRVSGIVANRWWEPRDDGSMRGVYCTDQAATDPLSGDLVFIPGPGNLRVPTFGDRLVAASPASRVVSISGKDRGAIFMAGRDRRHAVTWYDQKAGTFVTSAAYDERSPAGAALAPIVAKYNETRAGGALPGRVGLFWRKVDLPAPERKPEDPPLPMPATGMRNYQLPTVGLGWDHDLSSHEKGFFTGVYYSPVNDELVAGLALDVLADTTLELGHGATPDLLCLSFSSQDTVSHQYGNESEENFDVLRRLDVLLGRIFEQLDASFPAGRVVVALSADHGFPPIPEAERKRDKSFTGGRIYDAKPALVGFLERTNRLIDQTLCLPLDSKPLLATETWNLYYNRASIPLMRTADGPCGEAGRTIGSADVDRALLSATKTLWYEEIEDVYLASERPRWPDGNPVTRFVKNDWDAERSGDAILIPRRGVMEHWDPARGANHGTHHDYDTHVPLIFWGKPFPAGTSDAPATPYDFAPTMAKLFGVALPDAVGTPRLP